MLSDVKKIIQDNAVGTGAYETFVEICLKEAARGGSDASSLFVLAKLAQSFIEYYGDHALGFKEAEAFHSDMLGDIEALEGAKTAEGKLQALNEIVRRSLGKAG